MPTYRIPSLTPQQEKETLYSIKLKIIELRAAITKTSRMNSDFITTTLIAKLAEYPTKRTLRVDHFATWKDHALFSFISWIESHAQKSGIRYRARLLGLSTKLRRRVRYRTEVYDAKLMFAGLEIPEHLLRGDIVEIYVFEREARPL